MPPNRGADGAAARGANTRPRHRSRIRARETGASMRKETAIMAIFTATLATLFIFIMAPLSIHLSRSRLTAWTRLDGRGSYTRRPRAHSCGGTRRAQTFLVSFMGRSGSSAIMSELAAHPGVYLAGMEPVDHQKELNSTRALHKARAIFDAGIRRNRTVGFKIRPQHVRNAPHAWRALVREYDTRVVWQYRRNVFKDAVGEYNFARAARRGELRSVMGGLKERGAECTRETGCLLRIADMEELHSVLQRRVLNNVLVAEAAGILSGADGCVWELPYEDYLYDRRGSMADLQRFLGLDLVDTSPSRYKATGDNLCEIVENWTQVCESFYSCVLWQPMMDDHVNGCFCPAQPAASRFCQVTTGKHRPTVYRKPANDSQ